jgi:hypothetical protein
MELESEDLVLVLGWSLLVAGRLRFALYPFGGGVDVEAVVSQKAD